MVPSERRLEQMEDQLVRWSARIDRLAAKTECASPPATIGQHQRVDELRACRAISQARLEEYRVAEDERREDLRDEMQRAWNELAGVMRKLKD
jgi:hypothetical protein